MKERNVWWNGLPNERYWVEVTRRRDIGTNLKAPQTDERGEEVFSYSLITLVRPGDIVFHYDGIAQAIVSRSIAVGSYWEQPIVWAARGASARAANTLPHERAGFYLGLESFELLGQPLTLESIRADETRLKANVAGLQAKHRPRLHFPFGFSPTRPIRPMQGYLFKLPAFFVDQFNLPGRPSDIPRGPGPTSPAPVAVGAVYRPADETNSVGARDPFEVDPALVERALRSHAATQNALASYVKALGLKPLSPGRGQPNYDLAWQSAGQLFVAEVKSITDANEEKQLRLALGQVIRYAHQLKSTQHVRPVIVLERAPQDQTWLDLCRTFDIVLTWPDDFKNAIRISTARSR